LTPGARWTPLADLVPEGPHHITEFSWKTGTHTGQRAVVTAKRQAETGYKREPRPTHSARMKALWADPEWRARQVAAMQASGKAPTAHHTRAAGRSTRPPG
jgi:hypothetical protein